MIKFNMPKSNHVVASKAKGGWVVKKSGSVKASKSFTTKNAAVIFGRQISKSEKTELYIHKKDGSIQNRNSYGKDPYPQKG